MTKLDQLVNEFCPDGVAYRTIGEIAVDIYRGSGITREQVTPDGIPCVRYGEIYTTYGIWFDECVSRTSEKTIANKKYFEYGDVLFAITGESVEEIAKSCAYVGHEKCLAGGDIVVLKHNQDPKYLSYVLSTTSAQQKKSKGKVKSKVVHSSVPAIKDISIPIPPLPVQHEIVRILDNFTELIAELIPELTARKKQYEYYRDKVLTFNDNVPSMSLGSICDIFTGGEAPDNCIKGAVGDESHPYPIWANGKEVYGFTDTYKINKDAVVISSIGANTGAVFFRKAYFTPIIRLKVIIPKEENINTRYLFYAVSTAKFSSKSGSVPNMNAADIKKIVVPIPSLPEQERIVAILDRFDALCNDLTSGLPAEIEVRRKQYEYYRDKLLNFKEASA